MKGIVLVIEDNPLNLELVTDLLEANDFAVYHAPDATQGIRLAQKLMPDIVLMDFGLPGMDGLSATRALKNDPRTGRLAIIALTAHAMKGDEEMAIQAGCDGYITKPINTRTFIATISQWIHRTESNAA